MTTVVGARAAALAGGPRAGRAGDGAASDRARALESALEDLLARALDAGAATVPGGVDRVALVPDAHYPFHPSTGMVADPAVVAATAAVLERRGVEVDVVGPNAEWIAADRCGRYLGYRDALADLEAAWLDPGDGQSVRRTVRVGDDAVEATVPAIVDERAVLAVPSLRPTGSGPIAGAMRTLAGPVSTDAADDDRAAVAATRAVDPVGAVLDATTAYAGEPYAAGALLAGDPVAVDAAGAAAIGRDPADDGAISLAADGLSVTVDGLDFATLRADCPDGDLPPPDRTHPAVSGAYRLYAAVAGDAVPPQMEGSR